MKLRPVRLSTWLAAGILVGATVLTYANSFRGPFVFDDVPSILENVTIRQLWPPTTMFVPPSEGGVTVSGRPVVNVTLALNHAVSGYEVWSYHALNLLIHLLAGLTLYGLVRRTLTGPVLGPRFSAPASLVALLIAGLWMLHPLQTESVTYVIQRAESLMGLFFLLTLYAFARGVDSPRPRRWFVLSFAACLLGVGTKEVAALAPVLAVLYDRTFVSGTFRAAWTRHRAVFTALFATWIPLLGLVAGTGGNRGGTMGFDVGVSLLDSWLTQFEAVTRYLWLSFWPHPLVFDYGEIAPPGVGRALAWSLPVLILVPATLWALWRRPVPGFLGACFFGILAPTSIVPGALQMIVEHRMYLPLAAVIALVIGGAATRLSWRPLLVASAVLGLAAGVVTWQRNRVYQDELVLWQDTLRKRPDNARTHNNLGRYYYLRNQWDEAIACFEASIRLDPGLPKVHCNLGLALLNSGRTAEAVAPLETAVRMLPKYFSAQLNLGIALTRLDRAAEAIPHFVAALQHDPWPAEIHFHWGLALARLGDWSRAVEHYDWCIQLEPRHVEAWSNRGSALMALEKLPEAITSFETALRIQPNLPGVHYNLGLVHRALGHPAESLHHYQEAVRLDADNAASQLNLGIALAEAGRPADGVAHLSAAVRLQPDSPATQTNLGVALSLAGRPDEALTAYEAALRLSPDDPQANDNVGYALQDVGRSSEAQAYFQQAERLRSRGAPR